MTAEHPAAQGMRSTWIGAGVNLMLALIKGVAGVLGHSYALIADAIESLSDVFSSLAVASGLRIASQPPDRHHPYGHGKAEPLAAIIVGLALAGAAVMISVNALHEIRNPHLAPAPFTLIVLGIVIIVKETLYRFVNRVGEEVDSTAVKTDAWHHRSDAITSGAAFIGIAIALIGGKGYEGADDWAALLAAVIILLNAYRLLRPAVGEIMDEAPSPRIREEVLDLAVQTPGVVGVEKCLVRKMGFDYYVDIHVWVRGEITVRDGHDIASQVRRRIRTASVRIGDVLVHVEPDDQIRDLGRDTL